VAKLIHAPEAASRYEPLAKFIVDLTTGAATEPETEAGKDAKAVERGRRGGLTGGDARAAALSPGKRKGIAKKLLRLGGG
jgi:hypothetical protein